MPRNPDKVYVQLALDPAEYKDIEQYAEQEKRSVVNACAYLVTQGLKREREKEMRTGESVKGKSQWAG